MKNKDNRKQVAKTMTRDDLIKHAVNFAGAKMLDVGITSHQVSHQRKSFCMPGTMIAVGNWVENTRDSIPDLVTSEGIGGRTRQEREANARRIAALWNAMALFSTEEIETRAFHILPNPIASGKCAAPEGGAV